MNYFLFSNDIYASDGLNVQRVRRESPLDHLFKIREAHICLVEFDVLIASASESALDKKDGILAKKFGETYPGDYVLQDEKIANNVFQVIGIKSENVKEVYSLVQGEKVCVFVPYPVAIRGFLSGKAIDEKCVVFLDDLGNEKLITVFDGLKFSRTRSVFNIRADQLLSEIKRSAINFEKKLSDRKEGTAENYIIATNSESLAKEFESIEKGMTIKVLNSFCPAVDGLKQGRFQLKYILPQDIVRKRKDEELRKRTQCILFSALVLTGAGTYSFISHLNLQSALDSLRKEQGRKQQFEKKLEELDPAVYHSMLNAQKRIDFALTYAMIADSLPDSYQPHSFHFFKEGDHWTLEEQLFNADEGPLDYISVSGLLKHARIENVLGARPEKYLRVSL